MVHTGRSNPVSVWILALSLFVSLPLGVTPRRQRLLFTALIPEASTVAGGQQASGQLGSLAEAPYSV